MESMSAIREEVEPNSRQNFPDLTSASWKRMKTNGIQMNGKHPSPYKIGLLNSFSGYRHDQNDALRSLLITSSFVIFLDSSEILFTRKIGVYCKEQPQIANCVRSYFVLTVPRAQRATVPGRPFEFPLSQVLDPLHLSDQPKEFDIYLTCAQFRIYDICALIDSL